MLAIALFTGLIAGCYPAVYLSSLKPTAILKGTAERGKAGSRFRSALVVLQFSLSIIIIIGTGLVYKQMQFMQNKDLGYESEHLTYVRISDDIRPSIDLLKEGLRAQPLVRSVTTSRSLPNSIGANSGGASWQGKDPDINTLIGFEFVGQIRRPTAPLPFLLTKRLPS